MSMDAPGGQGSRPGGVAGWARRGLLSAPLLLPLVGTVGAVLGNVLLPVLLVAALGVACVLRLWRIAAATLLCALVAGLHVELLERDGESLRRELGRNEVLTLSGTVAQKLSRGVVLSLGSCAPNVVVRGETDLRVGDYVKLSVESRPVREISAFPGVFDAEGWKRGAGIAAECYFVRVEEHLRPWSWQLLRSQGLEWREELAARLMPPGTESDTARQVLCSLVLGARDRAEEDTLDAFRRGGCLHAFAVSGLHVGLFAGIVLAVLRVLRVPPGPGRPLVLAGVGLYVLVTGASVPALRAYLLLVVVLGALMLRRRSSLLNTWCFAALLVLQLVPSQLYNAGFLLSFGVYAALCVGLRCSMSDSPWFGPDAYIPVRIHTARERAMVRRDLWLRGVVVVSLSAWLVATPLSLVYFHTFNPWSVLTNIFITPILPVVMLAGLAHLAVGWLPWVGAVAEWFALKSAGVLLSVVAAFGGLPEAWLPAAAPAESDETLVVGCGYGQVATQLGNAGLLINPGSEANVGFRVFPAIFHGGFTPGCILRLRPGASYAAGAAALHRQFPKAELRAAQDIPPEGLRFRTSAGVYTLYPPSPDYPRRLADSRAPVILWEHTSGWRVLYAGNASADAWYRMPSDARRAQVLILGKHPVDPIGAEEVKASGARRVILLPGAGANIPPEQIAPAVLIRMNDEDWLRIAPEGVVLNGSKWSIP